MKINNNGKLIIFVLFILLFSLFYNLTKKIETYNNLEEEEVNNCSKTHILKHKDGKGGCSKLLRNEWKYGDITNFSNEISGGGMGAGAVRGVGLGTVVGNISMLKGDCITTDEYGDVVSGTYNDTGVCTATYIDPYDFCPSEVKLMHNNWNLKVIYPQYVHSNSDSIEANVERYYPIQDYVNDLIRIDKKFSIECPAIYIP